MTAHNIYVKHHIQLSVGMQTHEVTVNPGENGKE